MFHTSQQYGEVSKILFFLGTFGQNPRIAHWEGVKRMLRYFSGTVGEGMLYKRGPKVEVWGYSYSGHAGDKETSRRRSGYVFISAGAAIGYSNSMMKVTLLIAPVRASLWG